MQRADTRVFVERLFEAYYLGPERGSSAHAPTGADTDNDGGGRGPWPGYADVYREYLATPAAPVSLVLAKEMAHYAVPADPTSALAWPEAWDAFEHTFLIRSPVQQAPSWVRTMRAAEHAEGLPPEPLDATELGMAQLHRLFDKVRERTGKVPLVLDVEDLWRDPRAALTAFRSALGVPFEEAMLSWAPGWRPEFGEGWPTGTAPPPARIAARWNHVWVSDVLDSNGFHRAGSTQRGVAAAAAGLTPAHLPAAVEAAMHDAVRFYEEMREHRLQVPRPTIAHV